MNQRSRGGTRSLLSVKKILSKFESPRLGYCLIDAESGKVFVVGSAAGILGLKQKELPHYSALEASFILPKPQQLEELFQKALESKQGGVSDSFRSAKESAIPLWVSLFLTPVIAPSNQTPYQIAVIRDITQERYSRLIVESTLDGTFIGDIKNNTALFSGKIFDKVLLDAGFYPKDAMAIFDTMIYEGDREYQKMHIRHIVGRRSASNRTEYRMYDKKHNPFWISNRNRFFFDDENKPVWAVGGYIDVSTLRNYHRHTEESFVTSPITGLPNRHKMFRDWEESDTEIAERGYFIFIDIDAFSNVNTLLGFENGDLFLRHVATALAEHSFKNCTLYHNNADVFILRMPDAKSPEVLKQLKNYQQAASRPILLQNTLYPYSLTTVALPYKKGEGLENAIRKGRAEIAALRQEGGEKQAIITNSTSKRYDRNIEMAQQIRQSVLQEMARFSIVYQPIIQSQTQRCVGAEALLSWISADGAVLVSEQLIPFLNGIGLLGVVGDWFFRQTLLQCKEWLTERFDPDFYISINASPVQLADKYFANSVLQLLEQVGLSPSHMVIEITESDLMLDFQHGMKQLSKLKESGIRLAIDDFGTGCSSLSYLKILPIDIVKIDKSFIQNIEKDNYSKEFISSIIKITQRVERITCVKGVQERSQAALLHSMHCDLLQGRLFGKLAEKQQLKQFYFRNNRVES